MQFPYPTAALTAIPLRTAYLSAIATIVPPAMPLLLLVVPILLLIVPILLLVVPILLLAILFIQLTVPIIQLSAPTVPPSIPSAPLRTSLILFPRFIFTNSGLDIIIANTDIHISRPDFPTKLLSTSLETRKKTKKVAITCEKGTFLMPFRTLSPFFCHFHPI